MGTLGIRWIFRRLWDGDPLSGLALQEGLGVCFAQCEAILMTEQ